MPGGRLGAAVPDGNGGSLMLALTHEDVLMTATRLQKRVRAAVDSGEPGRALADCLQALSILGGWGDVDSLALKIWFGQSKQELRRMMNERLVAGAPPGEAPAEASVATVATKTCKKCGRLLLATRDFYVSVSQNRDGLDGTCKACRKEKKRLAYEAAPPEPALPPTAKLCPRCQTVKVVSEFSTDRHQRLGLSTYCKPCTGERAREIRRRSSHTALPAAALAPVEPGVVGADVTLVEPEPEAWLPAPPSPPQRRAAGWLLGAAGILLGVAAVRALHRRGRGNARLERRRIPEWRR